jgi:hypothetical protein
MRGPVASPAQVTARACGKARGSPVEGWRLAKTAAALELPPRLVGAVTRLLAAILAAAISMGLLGAVAMLFERDGTPFGAAPIERACVDRVALPQDRAANAAQCALRLGATAEAPENGESRRSTR